MFYYFLMTCFDVVFIAYKEKLITESEFRKEVKNLIMKGRKK